MSSSSVAGQGERERYEEIIRALTGLAQLLMTWHTLATLNAQDPKGMVGLVVENLTALLDEIVSDGERSTPTRRAVVADAWAATGNRRFDQAISTAKEASEKLRAVRIDALAVPRQRAGLILAISTAKEAFRQFAATQGTPAPELLEEITKATRTIDACNMELERLGHQLVASYDTRSGPAIVGAPGGGAVPDVSAIVQAPIPVQTPHDTRAALWPMVDAVVEVDAWAEDSPAAEVDRLPELARRARRIDDDSPGRVGPSPGSIA